MKRFLLALMLMTGAGCALSQHSLTIVVREVRTEKCRVVIATNKNDINAEDVAVIMNALVCMPDEVLLAPGIRFEITEDRAHLSTTWNGLAAIGHHSIFPYDHICLLPGPSRGTVWHEMAHFYESYLNLEKKSPFVKEWQAVAEGTYSKTPYTPPGEGVVSSYGRGNYQEDIADWVREVYSFTRLKTDFLSHLPNWKTDVRYRKKLDLLFKYHFINKSDYDLVSVSFK